jgi:hypothetical protein
MTDLEEDRDYMLAYIEEVLEQEIEEANAMASGNVVGYTGPLGMDTSPGHKILWSGDKKEPNKVSQALNKEESSSPSTRKCKDKPCGPKMEYNPLPSELWEVEEGGNVLDKMGQKHIGGAKRREPFGDTYVGFGSGKEEGDISGREKQASIVRKVNKNLNKRPYSLKDPPSVGLSITRPSLKDRPNHNKSK